MLPIDFIIIKIATFNHFNTHFYKGAGESGKSTIAKQLKILHLKGFSADERNTYKAIVYNNVLSSMKALVTACKDLGIPIQNEV